MILGGDNLNLIALKQIDADQLRIGGNLPELVAQRLRIRQRHGLKVFVRRFDHAQKQRSADGVGESGICFPQTVRHSALRPFRFQPVVFLISGQLRQFDHERSRLSFLSLL